MSDVPASSSVYLAGSISLGGQLSEHEARQNFALFDSEAARLRALGYRVFSPVETDEAKRGEPWETCMRACIAAVCTADTIAVLPGWERSAGAMLEAFVATQLRIPVVPIAELRRGLPRSLEAATSSVPQ